MEATVAKSPVAKDGSPQRWAVILVGLPGDVSHAELFANTADAWQHWLSQSLSFPADHVLRLPVVTAEKGADQSNSAGESIHKALSDLAKKLGPDDALWVFTLGHGHYDGRRAWWHIAGRDPSHEDFARWMSEFKCKEQVFWLTHSSSGWFVKPLSRPGRIVIAATAADDESNETEFPHALAAVASRPVGQLDADGDTQVSLAEFFAAIQAEVKQRFDSDKRLATEHAQLDDNGDGAGSEDLNAKPIPNGKIDGSLARQVFLPLQKPASAEKPASPE